MLAPITHILPLTIIRRERLLPVPGKVLVRQGQKIGASDVIAEANLFPEHLLVDIGRGLGMPGKRADKYIQCEAGEAVDEGDVLAGPVGFGRRVVRSPRRGQVLLTGDGQVLLEVAKKPFQLKAGLNGDIVDLIPERGVVIETSGALIQGVWGNGRIDFGVMTIAGNILESAIKSADLDVSMRGAIVLCGNCEDEEVFNTAAELPLRGLILFTMSPALAPAALKTNIPIMVLDGFGQRAVNDATYKLLSTNERREVAINAEPWNPYLGTRPELIIPLPSSGGLSLPKDTDEFAPGQRVRAVRAPYAGEMGALVSLGDVVTLPSGLRTLAAQVRFESGKTDAVPLANLEVLQ